MMRIGQGFDVHAFARRLGQPRSLLWAAYQFQTTEG